MRLAFSHAIVAVGLLAVVMLAVPEHASANGRLPGSNQIVFHPTDPTVIVARVTFGLVVSRDEGRTWRWICEPPMMIRDGEDPAVLLVGDGSILATTTQGVMRGANRGCAWSHPDPDLTGFYVIDSTGMVGMPNRAFVVTSAGSRPNGPWRSDDDGVTWDPLGTPVMDLFFETIDTAPSDPATLYMTGAIPPTSMTPRMPFVLRSINGGMTFDRYPFTLGAGEQNIYLAGVDPMNAARIYVRVLSPDGMDRLIISDDGGQSFHDTLALMQMLGFARSPDGQTVWAGGPDDGLWRSMDRGEHFEQISSVRVGCLAAREGELWVCGNNYRDLFAIGRSTDGGDTVEPMLAFEDLAGVLECPATDNVGSMCPPLLPALEAILGTRMDAGASPVDGGSLPGMDAGVTPADAGGGGMTGGGGGCGCHVASARDESAAAYACALGVIACALWWARRRRVR